MVPGRADKKLRNRSEQELAGYRDALDYLLQEDPGRLNVGLLQHLHRLLFARTAFPGGRFKSEDNAVIDRLPDGTRRERFRPVPAHETPFYVEELVDRHRAALFADQHHPVLLIGLFVLDLLVIHPYEDGNGRVARVLTTYLLGQSGYDVGRYVSLEQLVHDTQDGYYATLLASTHGWFDERHDPWPWLGYFVDRLATGYELFGQRAAAERSPGTKQDRIRSYVRRHAPREFRIDDVRRAVPGVSDQTIRLVLWELRDAGKIRSEGVGPRSSWRRVV